MRANEQFVLIGLHTLWLREHNRVAAALAKNNPEWDDERLFQEARRVTVAEYQHIIYNEWLPLVLGNANPNTSQPLPHPLISFSGDKFMTTFSLWPLSSGYSDSYRDDFDPRVTNEFAAAAFRFGHSIIPDTFLSVHPAAKGTGASKEEIQISQVFFKSQNVSQSEGTYVVTTASLSLSK